MDTLWICSHVVFNIEDKREQCAGIKEQASFYIPTTYSHEVIWPTINELFESETLKMVYKSVNDQAPAYLAAMFVEFSVSGKRELRNTKTDLAIPRCRSAFGQKCFSYKSSKLWNDLSTVVKSSNTCEVFKKHICNLSSVC